MANMPAADVFDPFASPSVPLNLHDPALPVLLFDIETNGLLDDCSVIHCICALSLPDGKRYSFGPGRISEGLALLNRAPLLAAHNGLCFDVPAIAELHPDAALPPLFDTLTASRLIWTNLKELDFKRLRKKSCRFPAKLCGSHSLEAWGQRLGVLKGDYGKQENAWETWTPDMQRYCEQDVEALHALWKHILAQNYSLQALALEHEFQKVIFQQEQAGAPFDERGAVDLYGRLSAGREELNAVLQTAFPPIRHEETFIPKGNNKSRGYVKGVPVIREHIETFNPNSREQIARRLQEQFGWQPGAFTDTGQPQVDEDVLKGLPYQPCKPLVEYLELAKIIGMLAEGTNGWLKLVRKGRIHGRVITNGAVTGRCTHSRPNLAQIPAHGAYGKDCRSLFAAPHGMVMVGADASGLELRMLAHYMARYDQGAYGRIILEGDIHTENQKAAGLSTRDSAKTFIYAFMYGAGDAKLGSIVKPLATPAAQARIGTALRAKFLRAIPALKRLTDAVQAALAQRPYLIGLDGRLLHVRSRHSALNTLLQSAGAVLMKAATVMFHRIIQEEHPEWLGKYQQILHVHDEAQCLSDPEIAEELGRTFVRAIEETGKLLGLRCPVTGEYKVGRTWAETH